MLVVSEHYVSVQGEGPKTGVPTQFLRFAMCNLRCPGWPCDTPHAIFPSVWRTEAKRMTAEQIIWECERLKFETGATNICITGGEPLLQNSDDLDAIVRSLIGMCSFEIFTNGTIKIPSHLLAECDIMMDWKLKGSGEDFGLREEEDHNRWDNAGRLKTTDGVKFVVTGIEDIEEAAETTKKLKTNTFCPAQLWAGVAAGRMLERDLVDVVLTHQLPWRLNIQAHKFIWPNQERGI